MELTIRGVIDDRIPGLGWPRLWSGTLKDAWEDMMAQEAQSLRELIEAAADALGVTGTVEGKEADFAKDRKDAPTIYIFVQGTEGGIPVGGRPAAR